MGSNEYKKISINVDLNSYKIMTSYELYDWGHQSCSSTPAFLLQRNCSDEELINHIKICYDNSGTISNEEYDNLGGFDSCRKTLKINSMTKFYRSTIGFNLRWGKKRLGLFKCKSEIIVHISVWKYCYGKQGQYDTDDVFDLKYNEECPQEFVVKLRQIMDEMYEKYHI